MAKNHLRPAEMLVPICFRRIGTKRSKIKDTRCQEVHVATRHLPADPFKPDAALTNSQRESEFGWGAGMHPDPEITYQHLEPHVPYAPPQPDDQVRELQAIRRMNTNDVAAQPDPYVAGNPDRYGPAKPLVRQRTVPCHKPPCPEPGPKFERVE